MPSYPIKSLFAMNVYIHLISFNKIVVTPNNKGALMSLIISQI